MSPLKVEKRAGAVILTLADPKRRNILARPMCAAIIAAVDAANTDPGVNVIIITGEPPTFCAGADLNDLEAASRGDDEAVRTVYQSFLAVANSPLPTIAAVNGPAIGAGFNLALACDLRIATAEASFESRFLKLGLHPGGGHGWLLLRALNWAEASNLLLGGKKLTGEEARALGLVQRLVEPETLQDQAFEMAGPMIATPRDLLLRTKASLRIAATVSHAESFSHETAEQAWSLRQPAFQKLVSRVKNSLGGSR